MNILPQGYSEVKNKKSLNVDQAFSNDDQVASTYYNEYFN